MAESIPPSRTWLIRGGSHPTGASAPSTRSLGMLPPSFGSGLIDYGWGNLALPLAAAADRRRGSEVCLCVKGQRQLAAISLHHWLEGTFEPAWDCLQGVWLVDSQVQRGAAVAPFGSAWACNGCFEGMTEAKPKGMGC